MSSERSRPRDGSDRGAATRADGRYLHNQRLGRLGEDVAAGFLIARGARVYGRNVRVGRGEIDLHVDLAGTAVAVEVKTIEAREPGDDAVFQFSRVKARTVRRHARLLRPPARRVDLIAVTVRAGSVDVRWIPFAG